MLMNGNNKFNYTEGLKSLLSVPKLDVLSPNNSYITTDDVNSYLKIIEEAGGSYKDYTTRSINNQANIKINTALQKIGKLNEYYPKAKAYTGKGIKSVKFLSSDPKVLMNKLKILLAEKKAGNNNVFNEISAISDELRRSGVFSLRQLKSLYNKFH